MLPNDPISLPRLNVADVHLKYKAARIEGRRQPLDNMRADLDIVNGNITLHPLSFGLGKGSINSNISLAETSNELHAKADVDFQRIDVDKLLTSAGIGRGAGTIAGHAVIDGNGRSVADILGHGNGELKLYMGRGGDLSALLVDISGLEFGNALLSALGVPNRAQIDCLITNFVLQQGVATARRGLGRAGRHLAIKTESKHFSIGSLPTPIDITGSFGSPSIRPEVGPLALRGGAAVALGIIGTPLAALIPTIQFGTGEDNACSGLLRNVETPAHVPAAPVRRREPARRR